MYTYAAGFIAILNQLKVWLWIIENCTHIYCSFGGLNIPS